jgi:hypothetical protein
LTDDVPQQFRSALLSADQVKLNLAKHNERSFENCPNRMIEAHRARLFFRLRLLEKGQDVQITSPVGGGSLAPKSN